MWAPSKFTWLMAIFFTSRVSSFSSFTFSSIGGCFRILRSRLHDVLTESIMAIMAKDTMMRRIDGCRFGDAGRGGEERIQI